MIEQILLTATPIRTFSGTNHLTGATGFFFERDERLFLVTSRHVLVDEASDHRPDRVEIELHTDAANLAESIWFSVPLYRDGTSIWRQGEDSAGLIDVAVIEIERAAWPEGVVYSAFTPSSIPGPDIQPAIGSALLVIGFPLGFHDTLHHLPVVRQAVIASSFGLRFQGNGYFLTDSRTHRGTSGAAVVMRTGTDSSHPERLPYLLLGIHSARLDVGTRDLKLDEALGLNCVWYADILMTLTTDQGPT
jgi:S1-C subfamily serine protease